LGLLKTFIRRDLNELHRAGVRVRMIGAREGLSDDIRALVDEAEALTCGNRGMNLVIAFNYGGRDEIARAARQVAEAVAAGALEPAEITPERSEEHTSELQSRENLVCRLL